MVRCGIPKTVIFYEIWEYNSPAWAHPLRDFYEIFRIYGQFHGMADRCFKFGGIRSRSSEVMGFNFGGAFSPKLSAPLAAKLYIGS